MILQKLLHAAEQNARAREHRIPFEYLKKSVAECPEPVGFVQSLVNAPEIGLIAELKHASPSAGVLREPFPVAQLADSLAAGGANCLSVLTEESYFQGDLQNLQLASGARLPRLQKDFILSEYQILEGRVAGADAVLLIAEALQADRARRLCTFAMSLGMDVLYEAHSVTALRQVIDVAQSAPERILVGINNRDLQTFHVDLGTTLQALEWLPDSLHVVGESGIRRPEDVRRLRDAGACGILVGESLMRQSDVVAATRLLLSKVRAA